MLEVIKKQLDANKFTLYRIVYLRLFRHSIPPESRRPHSSKSVRMQYLAFLVSNVLSSSNFQTAVSKSVRMHQLASLLSKFAQQFQLPKSCFKQRQNAPVCVLAFKFFSAVPTSRTSFQIASVCTIHRP
mgnify:CR=1 FL=1